MRTSHLGFSQGILTVEIWGGISNAKQTLLSVQYLPERGEFFQESTADQKKRCKSKNITCRPHTKTCKAILSVGETKFF